MARAEVTRPAPWPSTILVRMKSPHKLVLSAALAGMLAAVGFQAQSIKFGSVDLVKVFGESNIAKRQDEEMRLFQAARLGVIEFVATYPMMKPEDAQKFRELSLKEKRTPAEQTQLDGLKAASTTLEGRMRELQTKGNLTDAEKAELAADSQNGNTNRALLQKWDNEFTNDRQERFTKIRGDIVEKARAAVQSVGASGGYTIIFTSEVAPFAGTDVTAEALKIMNAKNK